MTKDSLKRVLWILKERKTKEPGIYTYLDVELAIMDEIGVHPATVKLAIAAMLKLKMIKPAGLGKYKIDELESMQLFSPLQDRVLSAYFPAEIDEKSLISGEILTKKTRILGPGRNRI